MKSKILTIGLFSLILSFVNCSEKKKPLPWNSTLDDNTIYTLSKPLAEVKKHLDAGEKFRAKGQIKKTNEEFKLVKQGFDDLEFFYIPLLNARAHVSAVYRLAKLKDFTKSEEELKKARSQIGIAKNKTAGKRNLELVDLTSNLEKLEKEMQNMANITQDRFIQIIGQIDNLVGKTKSQ